MIIEPLAGEQSAIGVKACEKLTPSFASLSTLGVWHWGAPLQPRDILLIFFHFINEPFNGGSGFNQLFWLSLPATSTPLAAHPA